MKKSNWIILCVALLMSAFLLWLWFWLGFDHVDAPLDLALSIIWWIVILTACLIIRHVEKKRRERVRICYVAADFVFNSEAGSRPIASAHEAAERIFGILSALEYGFGMKEAPEDTAYLAVVRSKTFEPNGKGGRALWKGEVAVPRRPNDKPIPFEGREQLERTLTRIAL